MSLDMIGEWILILLDPKSGNIGRLLLRFCDENQSENILCRLYMAAQKKGMKLCCVWYPRGTTVASGSLDRTEDNIS